MRARLEQHAEEIILNLIERATERDEEGRSRASTEALEMCLKRLYPAPRHSARVPYALGTIDTLAQCTAETRKLAAAVAAGLIDDDHANSIAKRINDAAKLIEVAEFERQVAAVAARLGINSGRIDAREIPSPH
jgi:hypothetical protein